MHRFHAEIQGDVALLSPQETQHASRVLRLVPGAPAEVLASGRRYAAVFERLDETGGTLRLTGELPDTEARLRVTLFQGLPKADKLELIIQKAVELGVDTVTPVAMQRSVVRLSAADAAKKLPRWQKIADEAAKQSGRARNLRVTAPIDVQALCRALREFDAALVPWEEASGLSLRTFSAAHPQAASLGVVIGPEGGITPAEIEQMKETGCEPVTLGPRILRTETAGLATVSALMCLYGEME